jgi:hypothetical protein
VVAVNKARAIMPVQVRTPRARDRSAAPEAGGCMGKRQRLLWREEQGRRTARAWHGPHVALVTPLGSRPCNAPPLPGGRGAPIGHRHGRHLRRPAAQGGAPEQQDHPGEGRHRGGAVEAATGGRWDLAGGGFPWRATGLRSKQIPQAGRRPSFTCPCQSPFSHAIRPLIRSGSPPAAAPSWRQTCRQWTTWASTPPPWWASPLESWGLTSQRSTGEGRRRALVEGLPHGAIRRRHTEQQTLITYSPSCCCHSPLMLHGQLGPAHKPARPQPCLM